MLTKQEIFTKVYETLRERGFTRAGEMRPEAAGGGEYFRCLYRSDAGSCAIGIFIEDGEYSSEYESVGADLAIKGMCSVLQAPLQTYGSKFFMILQEAHDYGKTPDEMQVRLDNFADIFDLEIPS